MSDGECFKLLKDYIATFPLTSNEKFLTTTYLPRNITQT